MTADRDYTGEHRFHKIGPPPEDWASVYASESGWIVARRVNSRRWWVISPSAAVLTNRAHSLGEGLREAYRAIARAEGLPG